MSKLEEGMQKLMGYVKEMREEGINVCRPQFQQFDLLEMMLISKHYPLVKRLVDNDKIDRDKVGIEKAELSGNPYDRGIALVENYDNDTYKVIDFISDYNQLLMLLAISDTPIDLLCSVLK